LDQVVRIEPAERSVRRLETSPGDYAGLAAQGIAALLAELPATALGVAGRADSGRDVAVVDVARPVHLLDLLVELLDPRRGLHAGDLLVVWRWLLAPPLRHRPVSSAALFLVSQNHQVRRHRGR
jgi:hypothetical protein